MLQAIISPAKQMTIAADAFAPRGIPPFPERTARILRALRDIERERGAKGLQELWGVSDRLLTENVGRLHGFRHLASPDDLAEPSLARLVSAGAFSYVGIQYRSMAPEVLSDAALEWLQRHLWILSGMYGCLRPYDAVQPYRLEMGAKLTIGDARNLYAFWGPDIAREICGTAGGDAQDVSPCDEGARATIVNLASAEYSKAVLPHLDEGTKVVTCVFSSSLRTGRPVQKSTESKTARGSMVRWMAEHEVQTTDELKDFDVGFRYAPELSSDEGARKTLVFMKA